MRLWLRRWRTGCNEIGDGVFAVSFGASFDVKDQIRQAIDIVDLVGQTIPLRREGRMYKGLCPWHDDSRPSLQVNPDRQSFKCWVCDVGGDVFSFVMKAEGVTFPEAVAMLAQRAGIPLDPHRAGASPQQIDEKKRLFEAMSWAETQFHKCLTDAPEAEPARRYLEQRGLTAASIQRFHLGFAPNRSSWLLDRARGTPYAPQVLEAVGLVRRREESQGYYDWFRGRVQFSIRDSQGRPVGFGGRVLPESGNTSPAKYVNSPETSLFKKSDLLYGLDHARDAIGKAKQALVMEGYTDCIVAHQCGFPQAVAVLGTALGESHVRLLRRYGAERVLLVLDGDEAGQRRTNEILELFVAEQVDLRILTLPNDLDPCDFLLQRGPEAFQALLDQAVDALDHKFRTVTGRIGQSAGTHDLSQAVEEVLTTLAKAPRLAAAGNSAAKLKEDQVLHRLARMLSPGGNVTAAEERLRGRLVALRRQGQKRPARRPVDDSPVENPADLRVETISKLDGELLELLLLDIGSLAEIRTILPPENVSSGAVRAIYASACVLADSGQTADFSRLLLEFDDPAMKNLLVAADEQAQAKAAADRAMRLRSWIEAVVRQRDEAQQQEQRASLQGRRLDDQEELELLDRIVQQRRERQSISLPTEGPGCLPRSAREG